VITFSSEELAMIQVAYMKRKQRLRESIEYVESVMQKKIFDNIRNETKSSDLAFSFDREIEKNCYTMEKRHLYDVDSSDDEKSREELPVEKIETKSKRAQERWIMK